MKQYFRYQIDFDSKWLNWSVIAMGMTFFATMVYYFGMQNFADLGILQILFGGIFPSLLSAGFIFLVKIKRLNAPGVYGLMLAAFCLCYLLSSFQGGSVVRIIFAIVFYILSGLASLGCAGGYLSDNRIPGIVFGVGFAVKLIFFTGSLLSLNVVSSLAVLAFYVAAGMFPLALSASKKKQR